MMANGMMSYSGSVSGPRRGVMERWRDLGGVSELARLGLCEESADRDW